MGGLGALLSHLKCPGKFSSVSAFAPISDMQKSKWGMKAHKEFFGSVEAGSEFNPVELVKNYKGPKIPILIDQGSDDNWGPEHLVTESFVEECHKAGIPVTYNVQGGYNHSFWFVSSFIKEHFAHHARALNAPRAAL